MKQEYILDRTLTKRPCIYKVIDGALYPVMYLQKAQDASDEDFERIVNYILNKKQ